jgi:cell division protein FtsW
MMEYNLGKVIRGDKIIWAVLVLLSLLSLLIVYSATGALAFRQAGGHTFHFLIRQIFFLGIGFGLIVLMVNVFPVKLYSKIARITVIVSVLLLLYAIVLKKTGRMGDASGRTLHLLFISFQPAELAKLGLVMYTAKVLGIEYGSEDGMKKAFRKIIIVAGIICGLIALSNFSTAALLFGTVMCMMFTARVRLRYLALVLGTGLALVVTVYLYGDKMGWISGRFPTVQSRLKNFGEEDASVQKGITQADYAKLAIYEGGVIGKGPGNSDVANFMAAAYNDFIFAIIIEEYGLVGGIFVILLYLILFFRGILIVKRTNRTFPAFLVAGLTIMLIFQAMINICVSSGVIPVTGQTLPWISLGGTSLLFTSVAFGCILGVSNQNQKDSARNNEPAIQMITPDEDHEIK